MKFIIYGLLLVSLLILSSCNGDNKTIIITDFSESKIITYEPRKFWPYAFIDLKIKGNINDTLKLVRGEPYYDILLTGELDTTRKIEYYGDAPIKFIIQPYKATKGKLEISLGLLDKN